MALTPGLQLPYGIQPINPVPVDSYSGPYTGATAGSAIASANSSIPSGLRFQSMMVRLIIGSTPSIYWYYGGTSDSDLVEFSAGAGLSSGVSYVYGTTGEIEVSPNTGSVIVGLPNNVIISQTLNINGITISSDGGSGLIIYGNLDVLGNINTSGNLSVDGFVMTKTAFLGYTGSASEEPLEYVLLDGGSY